MLAYWQSTTECLLWDYQSTEFCVKRPHKNTSGKVKFGNWSASYSVTDCLQKSFSFPCVGHTAQSCWMQPVVRLSVKWPLNTLKCMGNICADNIAKALIGYGKSTCMSIIVEFSVYSLHVDLQWSYISVYCVHVATEVKPCFTSKLCEIQSPWLLHH